MGPAPIEVCAGVAAVLGAIAAIQELSSFFPRLRLIEVLVRWRSFIYVVISGAFAALVLLLLRYLSEPSDRLASVEQPWDQQSRYGAAARRGRRVSLKLVGADRVQKSQA